MATASSWLAWLCDPGAFVIRARCGLWTTWLVRLYVAGNLLVALSYYAIPAVLLALYWRRRGLARSVTVPLRYQWVLAWFSAFIFLCGTTHVCECLAFVWPAYRLFTAVVVATGSVSACVAVRLAVMSFRGWSHVPVEVAYEALQKAQEATLRAELERVRADDEHRACEEKRKALLAEVESLREIAYLDVQHERLTRLQDRLDGLDRMRVLLREESPRP